MIWSLFLTPYFLPLQLCEKLAQTRGHRDICHPVLSSISDSSVGCSCPDIGGRKGNPFFIIENSFSFSLKMTIVRHRKVGAWNEECVRINLAFVFLPISIWILFAGWTLFNLRTQEILQGVGIGTGALDSEQSDTIQSMAGFVCPCRRPFYSLPPLPLFFGSCCVINNKVKGLDTKILALVQPDKYHSFLPSCCGFQKHHFHFSSYNT